MDWERKEGSANEEEEKAESAFFRPSGDVEDDKKRKRSNQGAVHRL